MSECLHSVLAAKTLLAHGQILQVIEKREEFLKLRGGRRIPVVSKVEGLNFIPK